MVTRFFGRMIRKLCINTPVIQYNLRKNIIKREKNIQEKVFKNIDISKLQPELGDEPVDSNKIIRPLEEEYEDFIRRCRAEAYYGMIFLIADNSMIDDMLHIYKFTQYHNSLNNGDFPLVRVREAQIIAWTHQIYGSSKSKNKRDSFCGFLTSSGTESNMCAFRAYFRLAEARGIKQPIIFAPISAHDSILIKSKDYGIVLPVSINPDTYEVNLNILEKNIKKYIGRVIAIVGSTPSYSYGICDPVSDLSALALKYKIFLHLDSCLGSLMYPFIVKKVGFEYPGVTSIAVDFHKFDNTPIGSSVILYRSEEIMKYQFYCNPRWTNGSYTTYGFAGNKCAYISMITNYMMQKYGKNGYSQIAKQLVELREEVEKGVRNLANIEVVGNPQLSIIGMKSSYFDIYKLANCMDKVGIHFVKIQDHICPTIQICLTQVHLTNEFKIKFIPLLEEGIKYSLRTKDNDNDNDITSEMDIFEQVVKLSKTDNNMASKMMKEYILATLRYIPKDIQLLEEKNDTEFKDMRSRIVKYFKKN